MRYESHPEAVQELCEARFAHRVVNSCLGHRFGDEVERVIHLLLERPERGSRLDNNLRHYLAQLQPGVTDDQLDEFEQRFGVVLPPGFRALCKWRNGQSDSCYDELHRSRMFSSLADIAEAKEILDGMIGSDFDKVIVRSPEKRAISWLI